MALGTLALAVPTATAHGPSSTTSSNTGVSVPIVMSQNVRIAGSFPETTAISGEFAKTGDFFYVSSADSITVFDTSDPRLPKPLGTLPNLVFENEAMTYVERTWGFRGSVTSTTRTCPPPIRPRVGPLWGSTATS